MRDFLETGARRFTSGWWFWALVLLALPNCGFEIGGFGTPALTPGDLPHSSAIMCDIEKYQGAARRCATENDLTMGIPLTMAAEAMVSGQAGNVGLDYSPAALAACGGTPRAIDFQGSFPDGYPVCLNCEAIPTLHADATAVCVAKCQDLVGSSAAPIPADIPAFCAANARPSTYFPATGCFDNACSEGGTLRSDFADPRRIPQPVVWSDLIGTSAVGPNLTQTSPTTVGDVFAAGAVSEQWVRANDAYVEFEASENNLSHVVGFAQVPGACPSPCTDSDPGYADIAFGLSLNFNGGVYVLESGALVAGPDLNQSFGTYTAGERFRVRVKDRFNGTAVVSYTRIVGECVPGKPCNESMVYSHAVASATYPLRVAAAFREQNATLAHVSIVRIP